MQIRDALIIIKKYGRAPSADIPDWFVYEPHGPNYYLQRYQQRQLALPEPIDRFAGALSDLNRLFGC